VKNLIRSFLLLSFLGLSYCGPRGFESMDALSTTTQTGYETPEHKKYVVGKEERLQEEITKIAPTTPIKMTPEEKAKSQEELEFHSSLKAFRFLRYDQGSTQPQRLGTASYRLDVQIQQKNNGSLVATFYGKLTKDAQGNFTFENTSTNFPDYKVKGSFGSVDTGISGKFTLSYKDKDQTQEATVLYRAYEARLNVRTPKSKDLSQYPNLQKKIDSWRNNTSAWMNNFSVPFGVSTFDIAIIRKTAPSSESAANSTEKPSSLDALLAFSGRSVETDVEGPAEKLTVPKKYKDQDMGAVELVGNAEGEDSKIISVTLKDDKGEDTEVLVDVVREPTEEEKVKQELHEEEIRQKDLSTDDKDETENKQTPAPVLPEPKQEQKQQEQKQTPQPEEEINLPDEGDEIPTPTPSPIQHSEVPAEIPADKKPGPAPSGNSAGNNAKSYMFVSSGTKALKIVKDFDRNLTLPGVQKEIKAYKSSSANLKRFFKYANPFRGLIKKIATAYQVPPQFAYVSVIESAYFTGGHYVIQVAKAKNKQGHYISSATGPFQIITDTAKALGLKVIDQALGTMPGPSDERRYFAPSACGAAKYFRNNADMFPKDSTLAVLAYNQGEGRAGQLAREYGYTFAEISRNNVSGVSYSNKKLAAYFIAGAYQGSSFDMDAEAPKSLPSSTVFPPNQIKDATCRAAVQ